MKKAFLIFNNVMIGIIGIFGIITVATTNKLFYNFNLALAEYDFYSAYSNSTNQTLTTELSNLISVKYMNQTDGTEYLTWDQIQTEVNGGLKNFINFLRNKDNTNSIIFNEAANLQIALNTKGSDFEISLEEFKTKLLPLQNTDPELYKLGENFANKTITQNYVFNKTPENASFFAGVAFIIVAIVWAIIYWSIFFSKRKKQKNQNKKEQ